MLLLRGEPGLGSLLLWWEVLLWLLREGVFRDSVLLSRDPFRDSWLPRGELM
jgi:hypothetical protein